MAMPALSRAEWDANTKRILDAEGVVGLMYDGTSGARLYTSSSGHAGIVRPELLHAAVALANDALPDDHPGRITAADVAMLEQCIALVEWDGLISVGQVPGSTIRTAVDALHSKLAALLRP